MVLDLLVTLKPIVPELDTVWTCLCVVLGREDSHFSMAGK